MCSSDLDAEFKKEFATIVKGLTNSDVTVVMVSHDVEFCAKYPHRCLMLFNGELVSEGSPREFFSTNSFYVTSSRRMSKGILENAVTPEDVIYCCTGKNTDKFPEITGDFHFDAKPPEKPFQKKKMPFWKKLTAVFGCLSLLFGFLVNIEAIPLALPFWANCLLVAVPLVILMLSLSELTRKPLGEVRSSKLSKRTIAATVMILLAIPVTIFFGTTYLKDERYLFISLLEDSGYMARAAFIMDRLMHKMGLHGKSFIPMVMGFGCNVPAIMATRTIESRKSRLITTLVIPLMSCAGRMPVYILIAGAFFPQK